MTAPEPSEADHEAAETVVGKWWDARSFEGHGRHVDDSELEELVGAIALVLAAARIDGLHTGLTAEGLTEDERRGLVAVYGYEAPMT